MKSVLYLCLASLALLARAQDDGVYQWALDVCEIISKETKAPPRAYLWLPPRATTIQALVFANHNMLEEPILAHPLFRAELANAAIGIVWVTPMLPQQWDALADHEIAAMENLLRAFAETTGHAELARVPLAPFGHSAMATYPYLFAAARPERTLCAVSIKGDWPAPGRPCWDAAREAARQKVPLLLIAGEYEDGFRRRDFSRAIFRDNPAATFSVWVDVGGGHFDWSDELCRGLGRWFAAMTRARAEEAVSRNGFWFPTKELADFIADYENAARGKGCFTVLGYQYHDREIEQNPKAHLQVVFQTKDYQFEVTPVFAKTVPPGRPESWTRLRAGSDNPRPAKEEESRIVLQRIQGPIEPVANNQWAVRPNRYDPRGARAREASFQMVYPGFAGFKRSVQQGLVRVPAPRKDFIEEESRAMSEEDFPLTFSANEIAYVREGPARGDKNRVMLVDVPREAKRPLKIVVQVTDPQQATAPRLKTYSLK